MGNWCFTPQLGSVERIFQATRARSSNTNATVVNPRALTFVEDIGDWNTSLVWDFNHVFSGVESLSALWGIGRWNTSGVTRLFNTFQFTKPDPEASPLDLSGWDVAGVTAMGFLFQSSHLSNLNLSQWDVSRVKTFNKLAEYAPRFNEDVSGWNTSGATDMRSAFRTALSFNQDITQWDVSRVEKMNNMFKENPVFNQPIGVWDMSSMKSFRSMFVNATSFNQDLGDWDVGKVTNLNFLFQDATSFNQNLCAWGGMLPVDASVIGMFDGSGCPNQADPVLADGGPFCYDC